MARPTLPRPPLKQTRCSLCAARWKSVFCGATKEQAETLDRCKSAATYQKGQVLFYEGHPATGVFCVSSGQIKLYRSSSGGRLQIVGLAGPGDVLGYRSLFTDRPYGLTAEALGDSVVCFIDRTAFRSLVAENPAISLNVIKELSQELESVEDRLLDQVDKPAHVRMARLLLMLKETHGKPEGRSVRIDVALSREEMAEMIGTTQETAIRMLSRFKARGLIALEGRTILIHDPDRLLRIARLSL